MDNENKNNGISEETSSQITADDLLKRLKSNIRNNPNYETGELDEDRIKSESAKESDYIDEDSFTQPIEKIEEVPVVEKAEEKPASPKIKSRLFRYRINREYDEDEARNTVVPNVVFDETEEKNAKREAIRKAFEAVNAEQDNSETKIINTDELSSTGKTGLSQKEIDKFNHFSTVDPFEDEKPVEVKTENEEISVESKAEKTNVFEPLPKEEKTEYVEKEEDDDSLREAEQLTFSLTSEQALSDGKEPETESQPELTPDDIKKSIAKAEAYIYERERIENPGDIVETTSENISLVGDVEEETADGDRKDIWIASAFGEENEVEEKFGEDVNRELEEHFDEVEEAINEEKEAYHTSKLDEEFTSNSQTKEIYAKYAKEQKKGIVSIIYGLVLLVLTFLYENISTFGGHLPGALNPAVYPVINVLISMQLLVLACLPAWKQLYIGARALLARKPIPETVLSLVAAVSLIIHIVFCFTAFSSDKFTLYVFPIALSVFLCQLYDYFNLRREILSFRIVSSKKLKYTINRISNEDARLENEAFRDYMSGDDVSIFKIGKTGFVNGFYSRMNSYPKNNTLLNILLPLPVAIGVIFFIIAAVAYGAKSGLSAGYTAFIMSVPFSLFISFSYPFFRASRKAYDEDSAIIGGNSLDEYSQANTISFDDKDVFPSYGVKVKSIKVYGDNRIDKILYNASSLFRTVGGPLADVFDMATVELGHSEDVELIDVEDDGIEATIDGSHVYAGRLSYLLSKNIRPYVDQDDEQIENGGEASIMYLVCDEQIAAKMYITYMMDPDFEYTLRQLYRAGLCIGIKTFDPNIDDRMLGQRIKLSKYPVRILRCRSLDDISVPAEESESGIVSKNSSRSLLQAFILCTKVLYTGRLSTIVKMLSMGLSVIITALLLLFGGITTIASFYVVLYQLFWIIPVYVISRLYI